MIKVCTLNARTFLLLSFLALMIGCGDDRTSTNRKQDTRTAVEYFKQEQTYTTTPHGKILTETVRSGGTDSIEYKTEDGKLWRVSYTKLSDGSYNFAIPKEIN